MTQLMSVSEARERILSTFKLLDPEPVNLPEAAGRVLAEDVRSNIDLPVFDNSSMDGFAIRAEDVVEARRDGPVKLKVIEDVPAGQTSSRSVSVGEAARVMTGSPLPHGANAIIPLEDTDHFQIKPHFEDKLSPFVQIFRAVETGDYVRYRGEDVRKGDLILARGSRLRPQDIGLLAMIGVPSVKVYRRPKIAIVSTGDELQPVGEPLEPGKIFESNAYTLSALVRRDGGEPIYLGIARDSEAAVREKLDEAITLGADLILSSAGVSVGAFDFVRHVVEQRGELSFWRVNMRPGKPLAFGHYQGVPIVGLPGNPVSAFIGYEVFVQPVVTKLLGQNEIQRPRIKATLLEQVGSDGRESYLRSIVHYENGRWQARLTGHQGSGNLRSLVQANALLIIPSGVKSLPAGSEVDAWFLDRLDGIYD